MSSKYIVDFSEVERGNYFFIGLHTYLCKAEFSNIWPDENLCEHLKKKLDNCLESNGYSYNWQKFYNCLDYGNRAKLICWYNRKMQ